MHDAFSNYLPDLEPIHLIHYLAPNHYSFPPGLEVSYDAPHNTHAYRFTKGAYHLHFLASDILHFCDFFPEEFSFLITLKTGAWKPNEDQCLFALVPKSTTDIKIGIRLYKKTIQVDYPDRLHKDSRRVDFHNVSQVYDQQWHSLIVSVAGDHVSLQIDCGRVYSKRLWRDFPAFINASNDGIHIGNCNHEEDGLFKVSILLIY